MRYALVLPLAGVLAALAAARADEPAKKEKESAVKRIDLKDIGAPMVKGGTVAKPLTISDPKELEGFNKEAAEKIVKQVDFSKQKLVLFSWQGSGQDKLDVKAEGEKEITFVYKAGLTRDLRSHAHLFAVPKDATIKVEVAK
jgi:hypothetical protein